MFIQIFVSVSSSICRALSLIPRFVFGQFKRSLYVSLRVNPSFWLSGAKRKQLILSADQGIVTSIFFAAHFTHFAHTLSVLHTHLGQPVSRTRQTPKKRAYSPAPCWQSLHFSLSILAYSRKTLQESSKVFVEHVLLVVWIQLGTQALQPCAWHSGSVMTIGLSYNGCSHLENQFDERKQDWPVHKFGLRRLKRLDAIQTVSFSAAHSRRQKKAPHARSPPGYPPGEIFRKRRGYCACLRPSSNVDLFMLGRPK